MMPADFDRLMVWLRPHLERDQSQGRRTTPNGVLSPEQQLAMTIQFMAGSKVGSLLDIYACGIATVYHTVWRTIDIINQCSELSYSFDVSVQVRSFFFPSLFELFFLLSRHL